MTTKTQGATFKSPFDLGYAFSGASQKLADIAAAAPAVIKGFPDEVDKATRAEVNNGFFLRYQENNPAAKYIRTDADVYLPVSGEPHKAVETVNITVAYCLDFTGQQYSKLRKDQPNLYQIVKPIREKAQKYASAMWTNLVKAYNGRLEKGDRSRGATKDFKVRIEDMFKGLEKSTVVAANRGDITAIPASLLKSCIAAFWATWEKGTQQK